MAISIPIISEFADAGVKKAIKEFKQLETTGEKAQFALKKAAIPAAAAVAGLAAAMGDAVKAAMEDEKSQQMLARQLKATTGATDDQIKSVEKYITAQGRNLGITDDQLRPALAGLVRVTKDVQEAQNAASLAADIAAAKNISLEQASKALERAYGGNTAALAKLDPSVRDMIKGGATLEEVFAKMSSTFGGAAKEASNTAAGGFAKLKLSLDETKESIGAALLPVLQKVLPYLQAAADWAQDNPKAFTIMAAAIAGVAGSILLVNAAMALNPFGLIAVGIGAAVVGITALFTKFDSFSDFFKAWVNSNLAYWEFLANGAVAAANGMIRALNIINPFKDIPKIGEVKLPRLSRGGGSGGGTGSIRAIESPVSGTATMPSLGAGVVAGAASRATGGGGAAAAAPRLTGPDGFLGFGLGEVPVMLSETQIDPSIRQGGNTNVTVNVDGGDPQSVVDAIQRWTRQNGPLPIAVTY